MREQIQKFAGILLQEKYNLFFYCAVYMISHAFEYYTGAFLRPLFLISYLWTLLIYSYHTFIDRKYLSSPIYRSAQVFLAVSIFSTFFYKANWRFSVLQDFAIQIQYMFVFFSAYRGYCGERKNEKPDGLIRLVTVLVFIISAAGIIAILTGSGLVWMQTKVVSTNRHRGFYLETNEGAYYAFTAIVMSVYLAAKYKRENRLSAGWILFCMINTAVQLVMIYYTGSRTVILLLLITGIYLVIRYLRRTASSLAPWKRRLIVAAVIVIVYILLFTKYGISRNVYYYMMKYPDFWNGDWSGKEKVLNKVTSGRWYLWKSSIQVWLKSPLIGYGLKSGNITYSVYRNMTNSHNLIINTLLFSGLAGLTSLSVYCAAVGRNIRKTGTADAKILLYYCFGILFISMLEVILLYNGKAVSAFFWAILGSLCLPDQLPQNSSSED